MSPAVSLPRSHHGGRAGWNNRHDSNPDAALISGFEPHGARGVQARARILDVVTAVGIPSPTTPSCASVEAGLYFDPARMHVLNHKEISRCAARSYRRRAGAGPDPAGRRVG